MASAIGHTDGVDLPPRPVLGKASGKAGGGAVAGWPGSGVIELAGGSAVSGAFVTSGTCVTWGGSAVAGGSLGVAEGQTGKPAVGLAETRAVATAEAVAWAVA